MALKSILKSQLTNDGSSKRYTLELSLAGLVSSLIITAITLGWVFALGVIVGRGYDPAERLPQLANLIPPEEPKETTPILQDKELTFMQDLKDKPGDAKVASPTSEQTPAPVVTPTPAKPAPKPQTEKAETFNYLVQAVAYNTKEQADRLRTRLEGEGLRSRVVHEKDKNGKPRWWRVQVIYRGTEAGFNETKAILNRMGVKDPTIASKTPVTVKTNKR